MLKQVQHDEKLGVVLMASLVVSLTCTVELFMQHVTLNLFQGLLTCIINVLTKDDESKVWRKLSLNVTKIFGILN